MAIDRISAEALSLLPARGAVSFLMLGRQHFMLAPEEWRQIADRSHRSCEQAVVRQAQMGGYAEPFLDWLGYGNVESMDFSGYEGCSLVHDLNQPVPPEWHGRYDVVFDGGTIEHVFHFPNAIANAMQLVAEGGYFVSCTPSNNYNGHGFYQFSPELFCRIFDENNGFRVRLLALVESTGEQAIYRVQDPKSAGHRITFGGRGPTLLVVIAEKLRQGPLFQSTPSQSDYAATWEGASAAETAGATPAGQRSGNSVSRLLRRLLPGAWLYRIQRYLAEKDRARRAFRGVTQVATLTECWEGPRP